MTTQLFTIPGGEAVYGAELSDDGLYRYRLWRIWNEKPRMVWIMLNPSTADAEVDDPTIRRCMRFAMREGCGGIEVINLYALRTTKPEHLLDHPDPEGPRNVAAWQSALMGNDGPVVGAWGAWAFEAPGRGRAGLPESQAYERWLAFCDVQCLGRTASCHPRHPLYLRSDTPLEVW